MVTRASHERSSSQPSSVSRPPTPRREVRVAGPALLELGAVRVSAAPTARPQAKLVLGQPGDRFEQEADAVADRVMREEDPALRPGGAGVAVQRKCTSCEQEDEKVRMQALGEGEQEEEERVMAEAAPGGLAGGLSAARAAGIQSARGGGSPLDRAARARLEPRFGYSFADVRVHSDARAASLARGIGARAFTLGHDVFFGAGEYRPGSPAGQRLLAHELTHVLQQKGGSERVQRKSVCDDDGVCWSEPDDASEVGVCIEEENSCSMPEEAPPQTSGPASGPAPATPLLAAGLMTGLPTAGAPAGPPAGLLAEQALARQAAVRGGALVAEGLTAVEGAAVAEGAATATGTGLGLSAALPWLVGLGILLWPSSTAPPWMDEMNPETGRPYRSEQEYRDVRARRAAPRAEPRAEPRVEPRVDEETQRRSCAQSYPQVRICASLPSEYQFSSPQQALVRMKQLEGNNNIRFHGNAAITTSGPCPGTGQHYNVRDGAARVGSVTCCPCCVDTPQGPSLQTRCRIVW